MRQFSSIALIIFLGLFAGWFSARLMLDRAVGSASHSAGEWREVKSAGDGLWGTYQSRHYLWNGKLQPSAYVRMFRRDTDDEGNTLRSDCTTYVEGPAPEARWWMLGADNGNEARSLSSGTIIREGDNSFAVTVSQTAQPGNWLRLSGSRDYVIYLTLSEPRSDENKAPALPRVKRLWC